MALRLLAASAVLGLCSAAQIPFSTSLGGRLSEWDLEVEPPVNSTEHLMFESVSSLLQQWPNTRYRNGHNLVPGHVPTGTLLYHGRGDPLIPTAPDWTATDPEHSLMFCRPFGGHGCWHLTLITARPLKVLYFDGSSAAKMASGSMDTQDIVAWGEVSPDRFFDERSRINDLCAWGKKFDLDGFVRMEMDFEVMLCDFASGVEIVSFLNLESGADGGPGRRPPLRGSDHSHPPPPELDHDDGYPEADFERSPGADVEFPPFGGRDDRFPDGPPPPGHRPPPRRPPPPPLKDHESSEVDQQKLFNRVRADSEVLRAGGHHNRFPGESRIKLDLARLISFYDTDLVPSLIESRFDETSDRMKHRLEHRLRGISDSDVKQILQRLEGALLHPVEGSGVDWFTLFRVVKDRYADRLEYVRGVLNNTGLGLEDEDLMNAYNVHSLLTAMVQPYILYTLNTTSRFTGLANSSTAWAAPAYQHCAVTYTRHIRPSGLTESEALLRRATEQTTKEICRTVSRMWAQGVNVGLYLDEAGDNDGQVRFRGTVAIDRREVGILVGKWKEEINRLMNWLDWSVWLKCRPACGFGVRLKCAIYQHGLSSIVDQEEGQAGQGREYMSQARDQRGQDTHIEEKKPPTSKILNPAVVE
ncbi:hypothetical protein V5O48_003025 [Marasmius crinis-equi]|uniref:Uncharacterized protein n=1 Tax=Marasmius crinis-equi TaxID=585013 RepID=A0ABR3FV26_9AGAR